MRYFSQRLSVSPLVYCVRLHRLYPCKYILHSLFLYNDDFYFFIFSSHRTDKRPIEFWGFFQRRSWKEGSRAHTTIAERKKKVGIGGRVGKKVSQDLNPSIHVMGYNAKLAVHYVQLRITLTRLTSDYGEDLVPLFRQKRASTSGNQWSISKFFNCHVSFANPPLAFPYDPIPNDNSSTGSTHLKW